MKPTRKEIEDAIKTAQLWTEDRKETDGIMMNVKKLLDLTTAARWCLELIDDDNPPLLPEEIERMRPKPKRRRT